MCGIVGLINRSKTADELNGVVAAMAASLEHRGPDDEGIWLDEGLALGQRRLSIVDTSKDGHQPMFSATRRYVVVFNGEIYNFRDLKNSLHSSGHSFRTRSDTEVLLAAVEEWGLHAALERFIGMFAFALWDRHERQLYLARDRFGEKPLYYGKVDGAFAFGSELKALRTIRSSNWQVDNDAVALFLRYNYIPTPYSIYRNIRKLPPGSYIRFDGVKESVSEPISFWSARGIVESRGNGAFPGTDLEAINELDLLLRKVITDQMIADVPLGAFLSGGIDSSLVVAIMQQVSKKPVRTFTIGFHEKNFNEAIFAKKVASHLGTDHTELYLSSADAMSVIPGLPYSYDEPFADSSQIPTILVAKLARKHVAVSLSGDAGDELFAGYSRYTLGASLHKKINGVPEPLRVILSNCLRGVPSGVWDRFHRTFAALLPSAFKVSHPGDKLHKLADVLLLNTQEAIYSSLVSNWTKPTEVVAGLSVEPLSIVNDRTRWADLKNPIERMMYLDSVSYLPDDILVKVDRASMATSLETRAPFLDHRVFDFAWQLPMDMKMRNGQGKWLLRQVLYQYVPQDLIDRPKMGFGVPIGEWLRGPLRDWAESLLNEDKLKNEGFFNPQPIRQKWAEHLAGTRNWQYQLWNVLMFNAWKDANFSR